MTNPEGRRWEVRVRDYLRDAWPNMERIRLQGRWDVGEFVNTGDWALECKSTKTINLSAGLNEAEKEAAQAHVRWHAAIFKRRNHLTEKAYVVMTLKQFRNLAIRLEALEEDMQCARDQWSGDPLWQKWDLDRTERD